MTPVWLKPEHSGVVSGWVARNIDGCARGWDGCVALAVMDGPEIKAGVIYHDFAPERGLISLSAYSTDPRWLTNEVLWEMFNYPFNTSGCQMVLMQVSEHNHRLLKILKRFGFDQIRIPRGRGRHEDEILCTLTDDQWRAGWHYRRRHGQAQGT